MSLDWSISESLLRNLNQEELIAELRSRSHPDPFYRELADRFLTLATAYEQLEDEMEEVEQEHRTDVSILEDRLDELEKILAECAPWFRQWANDYADRDGEVDADQTLDNEAYDMVQRIENLI